MRSVRTITAVDSHTEGMPTRVVTGGVGVVPGATMAERRAHFAAHLDGVRRFLVQEPRGHGAMSGAILQPACTPGADWGVLFVEVSGLLPMCGHGTIGVATVLVETGMVAVSEPETVVRLDTPAGPVEARVAVRDGRAEHVTLRNVASFVHAADVVVDAGAGIGEVRVDLAYGGNFYAILPAADLGLTARPPDGAALITRGRQVMAAVEAQARPVHPTDPGIAGCKHVLLHEDGEDGADARNAVVIHPGWIDRSPCGTGTSARMAQLHHHGALALDAPFTNMSIIGSRFTGRLVGTTTVGDHPAVLPEVTGRAWITGMAQHLLDPTDPFPEGFTTW